MKVLVTFAVAPEFAPWRRRWRFQGASDHGARAWHATVFGCDVTALLTGMGSKAAVLAVEALARERIFDMGISSGLAGALREDFKPGDIVAPRLVIRDSSSPELKISRLGVDSRLRELAIHCGARGTECLFTADRVLITRSEKKRFASRADAVDMESFEVIAEADASGLPCVIIRSISDVSSEDLPIDFNRTRSGDDQVSWSKVLLELRRHPLAMFPLLRFARQSRRAAEALADFLDTYIEALGKMNVASNQNQAGAA
jgi:adenosylhomocysteine nucleosidase